jgi:hypothetical protein
MKVQVEPEEARELVAMVVGKLIEEAGLSDDDRALLRRWRSEALKGGSEPMRELTAKLNAEIERTLQTRARSAIQRPDWK